MDSVFFIFDPSANQIRQGPLSLPYYPQNGYCDFCN